MGNEKNRELRGAIFAVLGGACWGMSGSMGQYLFDYQGMDSRWLVPIRLGLAGIILFIYCFFRHRSSLFAVWKTKNDAVRMLVYAFGICVCQFCYFSCIQYSTAGVGTILQDLSPIIILLVICATSRRLPRINEVISIALAMIGVFLITTHGHPATDAISPIALFFGIGSAVSVTIYNMTPHDFLERYPILVLQAWSFLMGGAGFFLGFRSWKIPYSPNAMGLFGIAFVVIVGNVLAFTFYMTGVRLIGPQKGVLYGFAEPVTAAIITFTLFGSKFTFWDGVGFAAIFAMLALISSPEKGKASQASA